MKRILAAVMLCMFSLIVTNPVRADYPTGPSDSRRAPDL